MARTAEAYLSSGTLRYSPKTWKKDQKWWLVVDCDADIGAYYRHLFYLSSYRCERLTRPAWKEHVTVVRNEEPPEAHKSLWGKYDGQEVVFSLAPISRTDGAFCWLDVTCERLLDIREELGLPREPQYALHLSYGMQRIESR